MHRTISPADQINGRNREFRESPYQSICLIQEGDTFLLQSLFSLTCICSYLSISWWREGTCAFWLYDIKTGGRLKSDDLRHVSLGLLCKRCHIWRITSVFSKSLIVVNALLENSFSFCLSLCPYCPLHSQVSRHFVVMGSWDFFFLKTVGQHRLSRADSQQDLRSQYNRGGQLILLPLHPFAPGLLTLSFLFDKGVYSVVQIVANMCLLLWELNARSHTENKADVKSFMILKQCCGVRVDKSKGNVPRKKKKNKQTKNTDTDTERKR